MGWKDLFTSDEAYGGPVSTPSSSQTTQGTGRDRGSNYDPGHDNNQTQYNQPVTPYVATPGTEYGNEFGGWEGSSAQAAAKKAKESEIRKQTLLSNQQGYKYKTQAEIDRDRKIYQSKTSMKEAVKGALGGLDYSWVDPDSDFLQMNMVGK